MSLSYSSLESPLNENLYDVYAQSFLGNLTLEEFLKTSVFCIFSPCCRFSSTFGLQMRNGNSATSGSVHTTRVHGPCSRVAWTGAREHGPQTPLVCTEP